MIRISKSSPFYARRLAKEINLRKRDLPRFQLKGSPFDGRGIQEAWEENGVVMGRSLNGDRFPINVECVFDFYGDQIKASLTVPTKR